MSTSALREIARIWPAHGAGSACGKSLGDVPTSTVGYELRHNPAIQAATDESSFVKFILAGQPEPPRYFARMKRDNRRGPALLASLPAPAPLEIADVASLQHQSEGVVLDTRARAVYAAGHVGGSILAELDYQFCAIAGSYIGEGTPITLVVDEHRLDEAVRALVRVGLDRIVDYVTPETLAAFERKGGALRRSIQIDMAAMEARRISGAARVLDVRNDAEFEAGHVPGAIHIPHTRIGAQLHTLPTDAPLLVYCRGGARAAAAVSLLERHGYEAIHVNDQFANYRQMERSSGVSA